MTDPIKVWVVSYGESRKNYVLQWIDPLTGKRKSRSAETSRRRDAERAAMKLEDQLNSLNPNADGRTEWEAFLDRFEREHCTSVKDATARGMLSILTSFTKAMRPQNLRAITTAVLSQYAVKLRDRRLSEATIGSHMTTLRLAMRWARDQGMVSEVPRLPRLARNASGRTMKGRPLTTAEFAKMLRATSGIVGKPAARSWRRYLRGLWLSGLRLDESLHLTWDDPLQLRLDFAGQFPVMQIPIEHDKGHRQRILPIAPDFARWLERTPVELRTGFVFLPLGDRGQRVYGKHNVSRIIAEIGKASGVVVDPRKEKYASAHDLRRSFGSRWAAMPKVTPQILRELMRHESIETTMRYYVGINAQVTAATLWQADLMKNEQHNT